MAYKRKNSPYWWVSLRDQRGKRIQKSTGTTDRKEAEALEGKWRSEIYKKEAWAETPDVTFKEVMVNYLTSRPANQSENAKQGDMLRAKILEKYYDDVLMNNLSARDVLAHRNQRLQQVKPATINRELTTLAAAISAYNLDYETDLPNPVKGRKLKEPEGRLRWISKPESASLIEAARKNEQAPHLPDFIILALNTGMRKQEMLGLEWRRVDFQNGLIHLEAEHTKTARRRTIPINDNAKTALLSRMNYRAKVCPGTPWVFAHKDGERIQNVRRSFETACKHAKITDFRIHDMRHTCAAWLVTAGAEMTEIRDLLGHQTIKTTERYAHLAPENVRAAVALLIDKKPGKAVSRLHSDYIGTKS